MSYDYYIHESLSNPPNESNPVNESKDANWFALEQSAKSGNVVPIIGPDALMVEYAGQTLPFYRLIAAELLASFQVHPDPRIVEQTWCLHHAVSEILRHTPGVEQRISRQIRMLVNQCSNTVQPAKSLCLLASIPTFTLYISLTPDNLLQQAMQHADPSVPVRVIEFSPRSASESIADLTLPHPGERVIFQMLGSCSDGGIGFAIHEEHVLEYCYHLQTEAARRFTDILSGLRRHDKLLINCNFPDWLGRSLLRLVTNERLYVADKTTQEFLCPHADDKSLYAFLTQFSLNTLGFDGHVEDLIEQLSQCIGKKPSSAQSSASIVRSTHSKGPTVFVSYASDNQSAALLLAKTLLQLGFSDVWLDQKKLIGGDDWSDRIHEAIDKCDFFVPLLSDEANCRREGVYWDEWKTAIKRANRINGVYLIPIGIDADFPSKTNYPHIAEVFFTKHLYHAPQGVFHADDRQKIITCCNRFIEHTHV